MSERQSSERGDQDEDRIDYRRITALAKPHWKGLTVATVALFVGSGIGLLYPQAARYAIDGLLGESDVLADWSTTGVAAVLLAMFLGQSFFVSLRAYLFTLIGERVVTDMRNMLYDRILEQEMGFFDDRRTGELTSRLTSDTQVLQSAVTTNLSMLLRFSAQAVGGMALLLYTSVELTLVLCLVLPVVLGIAVVYGRKVRRLSRRVQDAIATSTSVAEESLAGIRTVRSFAREGEERERYMEATEESFRLAKKRTLLGAFFGGGTSFLTYVAIAMVLGVGGSMVADGLMTPGQLTAFMLYTLLVAASFGILTGLYGDLMKAIGASQRVFALLDRSPEIVTAPGARTSPPTQGRVELREVTFAYPTRTEVLALDHVSFTMEPGEKVALVGHSGSGKSTVANLLSRFYDIQGGAVRIDGDLIEDWDVDTLREAIGVVAQEPVLFSGTIRTNVLYGRPEAREEEVVAALKAANAWEFVEALPDGMETVIGERGIRLSGGQKQRVAIARALLKDPRILILDEATSALDVESESLVQAALERLMRGRTTLIIAHRLSTIRNADKVVVL
ncbi:MAG: ABC transporter transmembrane domain-containing protein, partial [Myxococcota bacterium]